MTLYLSGTVIKTANVSYPGFESLGPYYAVLMP